MVSLRVITRDNIICEIFWGSVFELITMIGCHACHSVTLFVVLHSNFQTEELWSRHLLLHYALCLQTRD